MLDELIELLTRLIFEGFITEEEAYDVLSYFRTTGDLPQGWDLPLPIDAAIPATLRERVSEALLLFANLPPVPSPDVAQARFMDEMEELAQKLSEGQIRLKVWHRRAVDLIVDYLAQQAQQGAQRAIVDEEDLFSAVETQVAYFSRFADQTATGRLTPAQIRERSRLYSGEGRAIFYQQAGLTAATYGWVEDYIAIDDRNTCGPCSAAEAQGPYLPGDPRSPMPGRVCLGRGYCRCMRLPRYDVAAYLRLGGTP